MLGTLMQRSVHLIVGRKQLELNQLLNSLVTVVRCGVMYRSLSVLVD